MPVTPAECLATTWLAACNLGDSAEMTHYGALYDRSTRPQVWIDTHAMTGDLTPARIAEEGPNDLTILRAAEQGDAFLPAAE